MAEKDIYSTKAATLHIEDDVDNKRDVYTTPVVKAPGQPNALAHLSRQELLADVDEFVRQKGLEEHVDSLRAGALLAQSPHDFHGIHELRQEDKDAIDYEHSHRWSHPLKLYFTIAICSLGAATQGWDQTGSNGANLSFPTEFGIAGTTGRDPWLVGIVNAAPYISASIIGCWLSDPLNNWLGRRGTIFLTALCLIAAPIGSGFASSWETLFVCRLILGLGMGTKGSTVPVFAAENSPASIRGALVMSWQLWTAFGIFIGFCANVVVIDTGAIAWRLQVGSAFIPAVPLALGVFFCPESPRWLMKKNRYDQAYKSLRQLRFTQLQASRDLYYIHAQLEAEKRIMKANSFKRRFAELFTIPRVRRATLASFTVMIAQQMCGINIIAFYSSSIFVEAGYSARNALYASIGFGAVNFVFAWPAVWTIDTFGRRSLLLLTFPLMGLSLLGAGLSFLISKSSQAHIGLVAFFVFLFAAFYSPGEGPVPFTYSAEVFPLAQREMGMAWAVATCFFWSSVLSLTFPSLLAAFGATGAFCFYAGLNVVALVMIWCFVPETKALTLEELDSVFEVPTSKFIKYQNSKVFPHWFKRTVLRQRNHHLEPMVYESESSVY